MDHDVQLLLDVSISVILIIAYTRCLGHANDKRKLHTYGHTVWRANVPKVRMFRTLIDAERVWYRHS